MRFFASKSATYSLLLSALLSMTIVGCANKNLKDEDSKAGDATSTQSGTTSGADASKINPPGAIGGSELSTASRAGLDSTQTAGGLPSIGAPDQRSVYFGFDRYEIESEFKTLVAEHGKFIIDSKDNKMLIQGNADERGSREYNLALGQRRADAVKRALLLQGVTEEQIESVSLGEEKPKALGHDEASWAENRRADMLYRGEY